jgi:hypothetical protein
MDKPTAPATTANVAEAIRPHLEGQDFWIDDQQLLEGHRIETIELIDDSNLKVCLDNGQTFTIRVVSP